jgi:hypothetical protein
MWASGAYDYRYFALVRRDSRWRVVATVILLGLPVEHQVLHSAGKPDILVRTSVRAGAPGPTAVEAVNLSGPEVAISTLAQDLLPFDPCVSSAIAPDRVLVRDVNADGNQDVVVLIKDYSLTLKNRDTLNRLERACASGQVVNEASHSRHLVFTHSGAAFTTSHVAASLLGLEGVRVEPSLESWEITPRG